MKDLRKVEVTHMIVFKAKDHPGDDIRNEKEICFFHKFAGGYMSENIAIVESEDGRVHQVPLNRIRFLDRN